MNACNLRPKESLAWLTNYRNEIAKMKKYTHKTWLICDLTKISFVFLLGFFCLLSVQCTQATLKMFKRY